MYYGYELEQKPEKEYTIILLVFVFANFNFDKWIFLDVLWIPT